MNTTKMAVKKTQCCFQITDLYLHWNNNGKSSEIFKSLSIFQHFVVFLLF